MSGQCREFVPPGFGSCAPFLNWRSGEGPFSWRIPSVHNKIPKIRARYHPVGVAFVISHRSWGKRMALFSNLRSAYALGQEAYRGKKLSDEITKNMKLLSEADPEFSYIAMEVFLNKRDLLLMSMASWPKEKHADYGRRLRLEAEEMNRKRVRSIIEEAHSYGLWLAGAWLESSALKSEPSQIAHIVLEELAKARPD